MANTAITIDIGRIGVFLLPKFSFKEMLNFFQIVLLLYSYYNYADLTFNPHATKVGKN